jgi:putative methionine-R-sulfoxide reductase with GAF domain
MQPESTVHQGNRFAIERQLLADALNGVHYDVATFAEHELDDREGGEVPLLCPRLVHRPDVPDFRWPQRWTPTSEAEECWAKGPKPWFPNLGELRGADLGHGDQLGSPSLRQYLDLGVQSVLCFAIVENDHVRLSVLLGSKKPDQYGARELDRLRTNDLGTAMRTIHSLLKRRRDTFLADFRDLFAERLAPDQLAHRIVSSVAEEFDWDYVGIYRVERSRHQFVLIAQHDRTPGQKMSVKRGYVQSIREGMIGKTLRKGSSLRADDVSTAPPPHDYIQLEGLRARSALCHPVRVGARIEWILDCESKELSAFHGPDHDALRDLVSDLQKTLNFWFESRLNTVLLDCIRRSAAVVDADGNLVCVNQSARDLFGLHENDLTDVRLSQFAADDATALLFSEPRTLDNANLKLKVAAGPPRILLASSRISDEAFARWIWLFTDPDEQQWLAGLQYARSTVEQVAAQVRGPLMLAGTLVKRVDAMIRDPEIRTEARRHIERISENLKKADVTYERLARALIGKEQVELKDLFDRTRLALEAGVRPLVDIHAPVHHAAIWGDRGELVKALTELLKVIAAQAPAGTKIKVSGMLAADHVIIRLKVGRLARSRRNDAPPRIIEHVANAAKIAAKGTSVANVSSNDDAFEGARWRFVSEGGDLLDYGYDGSGRQIEVRLRRASLRRSYAHERI